MNSIQLKMSAVLTCPKCGFRHEYAMPGNSCQFYFRCGNCEAVLRPKPGDCCVFCSYADTKCPPKQREELLSAH